MPQVSRTQLATDVESSLPSNVPEGVSAGAVRGRILDLIDSLLHFEDEFSPTGSSHAKTISEWLTASPINTYTISTTLAAVDKSAWVHVDSASNRVVTLPNNWLPGEGCGIRRLGTGDVSWAFSAGATGQLPASRSAHTKISERYGEIFVRVVSNAGGSAAVWAIEGATA